MRFFILIVMMSLVSCSLISPSNNQSEDVTPYERKIEYIIDTKWNSEVSYKRASVWLAKNLKNAKEAIQLQDEKNSMIMAKMSTSCNTVNSLITMNFSFEAKDKKIRVVFSEISHVGDKANPFSGLIALYPRNKEQLADFKKNCLDQQVDGLVDTIEERSTNW